MTLMMFFKNFFIPLTVERLEEIMVILWTLLFLIMAMMMTMTIVKRRRKVTWTVVVKK